MDLTTRSPEVVTYRLGDKMAYVTPAVNYEQALDFAQNVFADDLAHTQRDKISFSVLVNTQTSKRSVRIGEMAWTAVVFNLKRYEIIDIRVQPELRVHHADAPPEYPKIKSLGDSKEATEFYRSKSSPPVKVGSRQTSPPARSTHSMGKGSTKTWLRLK